MKNRNLLNLLGLTAALSFVSVNAQMSFDGTTTVTATFDSTLAGVNDGAYTGVGYNPTAAVGGISSNFISVNDQAYGANRGGAAYNNGSFVDGTSFTQYLGVATPNGDSNRALITGYANENDTRYTEFRIEYTGAGTLNDLTFSADVHSYLVNVNRRKRWDFAYSINGGSLTDVNAMDISVSDGSTVGWTNEGNFSTTLSSLGLTNGDFLHVRWGAYNTDNNIEGAGGDRPMIAFDNITVAAIPEPSSLLLLGLAGSLFMLFRRRI